MDNLEKTLFELKNVLDNSDIIKEYLSLKEVYENDDELREMRREIARLKSENKNEEHEALLEIYNSHPIVVNYEQAREEVISLLEEIKEVLSD